MSDETSLEDKIKVMEHASLGGQIEYRNKGSHSDWDDIQDPLWNWEIHEYRIKIEIKFMYLYCYKTVPGNYTLSSYYYKDDEEFKRNHPNAQKYYKLEWSKIEINS